MVYNLLMKTIENICLFTPQNQRTTNEDLGIINLIYEKSLGTTDKFLIGAVFQLCVVVDGNGVFGTLNRSYSLKRGDVFCIFPAVPYFVSNENNLKFIYVKFSSTYAYSLFDNLKLTKNNCYYENREYIVKIWELAFSGNLSKPELTATGLVLLTLTNLQPQDAKTTTKPTQETKMQNILNLINDNYCDSSFNLSTLAEMCFYNKKYLSDLFKARFNIPFNTYLTQLRIENAAKLIGAGFTSIKEIAQLSGFSDPLYFSKVFKKYNYHSPAYCIKQEQLKHSSKYPSISK